MLGLSDDTALYALVSDLQREKLSAFVQRAFDPYRPSDRYEHNWHVDAICEHLQAAYKGDIKRLIINIPPRFLKSFICSICFPAWVLGHNPSERFVVASHTMRPLAVSLSNDFRLVVGSNWYKQLFPEMRLARDSDFEALTTKNGYRRAFGTNSPTGTGCNYLIIDDPNKPDEVSSPALRNSVNDWVDSTAMSRFDDRRTGRCIIVQQRLHEDDVTGHMLARGGWTHLKLPAESRKRLTVVLGNKKYKSPHETLLFPERFDETILQDLRRDLGDYAYAGQYLQEPAPIGGGVLRRDLIKFYDKVSPRGMNLYILCDPAGIETPDKTKREKKSDWTAFIVVGLASDNNRYILDIVRDKLGPTDRINKLFDLHRKWNEATGKPPKVGYEAYGLQSDFHYIERKQEDESYRFNIKRLGGRMSKVDRIMRMEPDLCNGRWWWPKMIMYTNTNGDTTDLVSDIINGEMVLFPFSKHDDCLDAIARIYDDDLEAVFPKIKPKDNWADPPSQSISWMDY